jgi:hypothetical protein
MGEGSASRPGRVLPPGQTRYPFYRTLGGPQGRSVQVRKISPPPGFDPRIVQPVGSRYTDWATRAHEEKWHVANGNNLGTWWLMARNGASNWAQQDKHILAALLMSVGGQSCHGDYMQ